MSISFNRRTGCQLRPVATRRVGFFEDTDHVDRVHVLGVFQDDRVLVFDHFVEGSGSHVHNMGSHGSTWDGVLVIALRDPCHGRVSQSLIQRKGVDTIRVSTVPIG